MNALARFLLERGKSLVSKKLGAALAAEGAVTGTDLAGVPLCIYIVVKGLQEAWQYWVNRRWPV